MINIQKSKNVRLVVQAGVLTGYSEVWLNDLNDYTIRHMHKCGDRMVELANEFANEKNKTKIKALNQCARELLLLQSSDWSFIITNRNYG